MDLPCDLEIRHYIQISSEIDTGRGRVWELFQLASLIEEAPRVQRGFLLFLGPFFISQPSLRIVYYPSSYFSIIHPAPDRQT